MKYLSSKSSAFTLVEMAIVLLIIGIITASIIGGRAYVRQAEVYGLASEITDIRKAVDTFSEMYGSYPGDMTDASIVFGCTGCDGDGDGELNGTELQLFWQHLSLANLIEGTYDGSTTVGVGIPISQIDGTAVYKVRYENDRLVLVLEGLTTDRTALSPEEIEQIDARYDNGHPLSGMLSVEPGSGFTTSDCITNGRYNVGNNSRECRLLYVLIGDEFFGYHWESDNWNTCNGSSSWSEVAITSCTKDCPEDGKLREGCCVNSLDPTCSGACGTGYRMFSISCNRTPGTQSRNVYCADEDGGLVADSLCVAADKPDTTQTCTNECDIATRPLMKRECDLGTCDWYTDTWTCDASPVWSIGAWGVCTGAPGSMTETRTVTCPEATGTKVRAVTCPYPNCDGVKPIAAASCTSTEFGIACPPPTPDSVRSCEVDSEWSVSAWSDCLPSPTWSVGGWGVCSEVAPSCTVGIEARTISCTDQAGTRTRSVNCISAPCSSPAPDSSEACTATCATPVPASSRTCNDALTVLTIENSVSTVTLHTEGSGSWVGCVNTN